MEPTKNPNRNRSPVIILSEDRLVKNAEQACLRLCTRIRLLKWSMVLSLLTWVVLDLTTVVDPVYVWIPLVSTNVLSVVLAVLVWRSSNKFKRALRIMETEVC